MSRHCQLTGVFAVRHDVSAALSLLRRGFSHFRCLGSYTEWYKTTLTLFFMCCEACNILLGSVLVKRPFLPGIIHLQFRGHVHAWRRPFFFLSFFLFLFLAFNHQHELGSGNMEEGKGYICLGYGAIRGEVVSSRHLSDNRPIRMVAVWNEWLGVLLSKCIYQF